MFCQIKIMKYDVGPYPWGAFVQLKVDGVIHSALCVSNSWREATQRGIGQCLEKANMPGFSIEAVWQAADVQKPLT